MPKHNETGVNGEREAEKFLKNKGYHILYRNWRSGKKEIDIIALNKGVLIFVEVKTRTGRGFGFPEDAVDYKKQGYLKEAAADFLDCYSAYQLVQFDIISVIFSPDGRVELLHFEDAFF